MTVRESRTPEVSNEELEQRFEQVGVVGLAGQRRPIWCAAQDDGAVLLTGSTGSGKTYIARAIHDLSARNGAPFVEFNAGEYLQTPGLLAAKLLGHVRGAFTGAIQGSMGVFEKANGGTLLIDEIGELPPDQQVALLHVVESGEVSPLGTQEKKSVTARVIAATNRDVRKELEQGGGNFRVDLYYRLARHAIELPALSKRPEDIALLVRHLIRTTGYDGIIGIDDNAVKFLEKCTWQGGVRELRTFIHAVCVHILEGNVLTDEHITLGDIQEYIQVNTAGVNRGNMLDQLLGEKDIIGLLLRRPELLTNNLLLQVNSAPNFSQTSLFVNIQLALLLAALQISDGSNTLARTATAIGIERSTIYRWLRKIKLAAADGSDGTIYWRRGRVAIDPRILDFARTHPNLLRGVEEDSGEDQR